MVCAIINRTLAETHAALGEAAFAAAWARGETLSPAQAMELALSGATIGAPQLSDDLPGAC